MRATFPGFYRPSEEEFRKLWEEALVSFDANVLLGLYRYSPKTRTLFFRNVSGLSRRVWLSHQAAFEYQRWRARTIREERKKYEDALRALDDCIKKLRHELEPFKQRHTYIDPDSIVRQVSQAVEKAKASVVKLRDRHPDLLKKDSIRSRLDGLFRERVGRPYVGELRETVLREASRRVENRVPPGFADREKEGENRYGDVLVWMQLLDKAEADQRSIIFVTDDRKEDWWEMDGKITLGPRPELLQELHERAGVSGYLYSSPEFIRRAQEFLDLGSEAEAQAAAEEVEDAQAEAAEEAGEEPNLEQIVKELQRREFVRRLPSQRIVEQIRRDILPATARLTDMSSVFPAPTTTVDWQELLESVLRKGEVHRSDKEREAGTGNDEPESPTNKALEE